MPVYKGCLVSKWKHAKLQYDLENFQKRRPFESTWAFPDQHIFKRGNPLNRENLNELFKSTFYLKTSFSSTFRSKNAFECSWWELYVFVCLLAWDWFVSLFADDSLTWRSVDTISDSYQIITFCPTDFPSLFPCLNFRALFRNLVVL